jgi:hypothetical protein
LTTKTQTKEKPFIDPDWTETATEFLQEAGKIVLQGALFSMGGMFASKIAHSYTARSTQKLISASSNVLEMKDKVSV